MKIILFLLFIANLIIGYLIGVNYISHSISNLLCVIMGYLFSYCLKQLK